MYDEMKGVGPPLMGGCEGLGKGGAEGIWGVVDWRRLPAVSV